MTDTTSAGGDVADFVGKWRAAWPERALVDGFVPAPQRAVADAWEALQFEWQEAAWRGDARPGELKLQWWVDELDGWSQGRRRHPLGSVLQRQALDWRALARALPTVASTRDRPVDGDAAWRALEPLAAALSRGEAALFGGTASADAVVATWLHARLARHPDAAVPQAIGTAHEVAGAPDPARERLEAWRLDLLRRWPRTRGLPRPRGIAAALAHARLRRGDASSSLPPLSALWAGWRGARG